MAKIIATLVLALSTLVTASIDTSTSSSGNTTLIYQFPNGTWVENIAVRNNSQLLLTIFTSPDLYSLDPTTSNAEPTLLHTFANATATFGITEYAPDVFAVAVGNFSLTSGTTPGSYAVYRVDFSASEDDKPDIELIAAVPDADALNGICTLPNDSGSLLLADIKKGQVFRMDLETGESTVVVPSTNSLTMIADSSFGPAGIDGIHVLDDYLYTANIATGDFGKLAITSNGTLVANTDPVVIAQAADGAYWDDFVLDDEGNAYAVTGSGNTLLMISPEGVQTLLAGDLNSTELAQPTSVNWSRGEGNKRLYVVTAGGLQAPVNGDEVVGGQVVALDL
ncbi:hypothetical protein P280DRAFT_469300 [Massarina eburnea CBS 473.64]|uniref:SMP-30/Gluconolactonase/LRE-like region domain-containing protein n=1 Tax=Massarina eburnea CBS 473.64 TaxID=1395130 RepID=A0A6A6RZA0_9PLEO|nr:hypothetical protein P280DRAFT_469300 [Massarina eburnea CBS 473.64]